MGVKKLHQTTRRVQIYCIEDHGPQKINEFFKKHGIEQRIEYSTEATSKSIRINFGDAKVPFFWRDGVDVPIPYSEESLGNKVLLDFLPSYLSVKQNPGILLVDEFSSGFHNDLEELLIKEFMKTAKNSQIILVTHSTNLLTTSLLRPDQIYSVSFDGERGSSIKRFPKRGLGSHKTLKKCIGVAFLVVFLSMIRLNRNKSIGQVLFIVEGSKNEFSLLRRIFL